MCGGWPNVGRVPPASINDGSVSPGILPTVLRVRTTAVRRSCSTRLRTKRVQTTRTGWFCQPYFGYCTRLAEIFFPIAARSFMTKWLMRIQSSARRVHVPLASHRSDSDIIETVDSPLIIFDPTLKEFLWLGPFEFSCGLSDVCSKRCADHWRRRYDPPLQPAIARLRCVIQAARWRRISLPGSIGRCLPATLERLYCFAAMLPVNVRCPVAANEQTPRYAEQLAPLNKRGIYVTPARGIAVSYVLNTFKYASNLYHVEMQKGRLNTCFLWSGQRNCS